MTRISIVLERKFSLLLKFNENIRFVFIKSPPWLRLLLCAWDFFRGQQTAHVPRESYAIHLAGGSGQASSVMSDSVMDLYSDHILLIRLEDFETIREYQSTDAIYPASLTKIMTGILAIEALDNFDEKIIIQPEWIRTLKEKNASMAGFSPGEAVCVRDLLYGTLLPSGADGALALAWRISGSEESLCPADE